MFVGFDPALRRKGSENWTLKEAGMAAEYGTNTRPIPCSLFFTNVCPKAFVALIVRVKSLLHKKKHFFRILQPVYVAGPLLRPRRQQRAPHIPRRLPTEQRPGKHFELAGTPCTFLVLHNQRLQLFACASGEEFRFTEQPTVCYGLLRLVKVC